MVSCPKCGSAVTGSARIWPFPAKGSLNESEGSRLTEVFECSSCKARFRAELQTETAIGEIVSIKNVAERIRGIKGELMQTLKNLNEKIKTLETERANLMIEIDTLRKVAESRANALEGEVSMLRDEVKSLRELLGYGEE